MAEERPNYTEKHLQQELPQPASRWTHRNGNIYVVESITNLPNKERYPTTVVYRGSNGNLWSRPFSDWHRSMTPV